MLEKEKQKLTEEDLKRMKEEIMGKTIIQLPPIQQNQNSNPIRNQSLDLEERQQNPIQKKEMPQGLKDYHEQRRQMKNTQNQQIVQQQPQQKTGITKTQLNQILEENKVLTEQMSLLQTKISLQNQEEFNYQILVIASQLVMSLQEIKKELNSISLQIYDSNKIAAGDSGEVIEDSTQEESINKQEDLVQFDEEPNDESEDPDLSDD